jgi:GNAT superfamily N-acetyltransferase
MRIRQARPAEYAAIGELTVAAYVDGGYVPHGHGYVDELADTMTRATGAEIWVAVGDDGELLGSITWCPVGSTWREIARDDEGEFRMLAVAGGSRRGGVGRALIQACLDEARGSGLAGVAISTMAEMSDAQRVYERLGFRRAPEDDWSPVEGVDLLAFRIRFPDA